MTKSNTQRFVGAAWSLLSFQLIASVGAVAVTAYAAFQIQPHLAPIEQAAPDEAVEAIPGPQSITPQPPNGGAATITVEGEAAEGKELRAVLSDDPDGMGSRPRFQWLRDGAVIPDASNAVYVATEADVGHSLAARADYVDGADYNESVISAAVAVPRPAPVIPACQRVENAARVAAAGGWCDSGFVVQAGQPVVIRARGRWSNAGAPNVGPEGTRGYRHQGTEMADADLAALIGHVGGVTFAVGAGVRHVSNVSGPLYLSINDVPGTFGDNQGSVDVYVSVGGVD